MTGNESFLVIVVLAVLAGGGIIVVDAIVIRKIRRQARPTQATSEDPTIDE